MQISNATGGGRLLDQAQKSQQTQLQRISSAKRINSAKDDAAGLAIATKLDTQDRSMQAALRNSLDGVSRLQVEEGALNSVTEDLQRIRELKVQQQNGILSDEGKQVLQSEIDSRLSSIEDVFSQSEFNGQSLFKEGEMGIQSGPNAGDQIEIASQDIAAKFSTIGVTSESSDINLDNIDEALSLLSTRRAELGALENRLDSNVDFLALRSEQNQVASSRIQDTDLAQALSEKSKADIQVKVNIAVQSQANLNQGQVLHLLNNN